MKKCRCCKLEKNFFEFGKLSRSKDGYDGICKGCKKIYSANIRNNFRDKINEQQRNFYNKNIEENRLKNNKKNRKIYYANLEKYRKYQCDYGKTVNGIYRAYKTQAKSRGFEFQLTKELFIEKFGNTKCHYCNDHIERIGIDRKDSLKGYTIDNIVDCCKICNRMKWNVSYYDFIKQIRKIHENFIIQMRF